jgi:hypothetical protein
MKTIRFSDTTDPALPEVLSPFSGQFPSALHARSSCPTIILFPGNGAQIMRVPQLGYSLETLAFGICGAASFALLLMIALGVK